MLNLRLKKGLLTFVTNVVYDVYVTNATQKSQLVGFHVIDILDIQSHTSGRSKGSLLSLILL